MDFKKIYKVILDVVSFSHLIKTNRSFREKREGFTTNQSKFLVIKIVFGYVLFSARKTLM